MRRQPFLESLLNQVIHGSRSSSIRVRWICLSRDVPACVAPVALCPPLPVGVATTHTEPVALPRWRSWPRRCLEIHILWEVSSAPLTGRVLAPAHSLAVLAFPRRPTPVPHKVRFVKGCPTGRQRLGRSPREGDRSPVLIDRLPNVTVQHPIRRGRSGRVRDAFPIASGRGGPKTTKTRKNLGC